MKKKGKINKPKRNKTTKRHMKGRTDGKKNKTNKHLKHLHAVTLQS